jgi:hydrogenase maturation protein HypF
VQGVGFRPFIYLLAREMNIKGTVINRNNGVLIRADLSEKQRKELIERISTEYPPIASIHHIEIRELPESTDQYIGFSIAASCSESDEITQIAPDIAVCDDCLNDRISQPHRIGYPFVNCTRCGPRFSIIEDLPYDRNHTTMSSFAMCPECRKEYTDITDRRFHAQPVACNHCGPIYYMTYRQKIYTDYREIIAITSRMLNDGKIIAVKGIGGYHLACDATHNAAVKRLRRIKIRDTKPFAVMFKDIGHLLPYVFLNEKEKENLLSRRRPIVLLKQRKSPAPDVNPGMRTLGCMLPYMPVHYDWFQYIDSPVLVMTSGNISDVPIAVMPEEAEQQLGGKVDLLLHHNRPIRNRVDDSVVQVCNNRTCIIRRSRGYAPEPFFPDTPVEGILAFGAEKTNTFALGRKNTVI